jgi:3-oxoacyl-[acyl-carrier-protein] synthase-1
MFDSEGDPMVVAMAPYLSDDVAVIDRFQQLALPAAQEALAPLIQLTEGMQSIPLIVGLPATRPGLPADLGTRLAESLKSMTCNGWQVSETQVISSGHSAGLIAVEAGLQRIKAGHAEFCLVGGVDSYLEVGTLEWLDDNEQLHKTINAWGFIPGEAASFCLICSSNTAFRYKLPIMAQIVAISTASEKNKIKTKTVCLGQGLTQAVRNTIQALPKECRIDYTICDQNGEAYRADEFGFMLCRLSEYFVEPSNYMAPADCWGDVGAASGPLFILLAAMAGLKGYEKGPHTLIWTSSEGGERAATILCVDVQERGA